ncbi:BTB/POZ domain-containing protein At5g48130 [Oryza brachyantha]|uniref:BTB/POZ domain-containing protein At5g48130 n=1 Tax=Oryza brachyantha TaxID=4533 RepID=UPI00077680BA|nr:BTB/POZ domain-containing protein At5g48130 [Oryza brachyantha]XP_040382042.1 BTB/POZ domain-containing protein At5g48130 [Oryza brachyantha]
MEPEVEVEMSPAAKGLAEGVFSPYSSPSTALLLQRRVVAWAKETGLPATVSVRVGERSFSLHKDPLVSRCGYLSQEALMIRSGDGEVVELPASFPGGNEAFEVIGLFCYGDAVALDPFNVAAVRCAAEFLDVAGLGARCDLYINQVVLQSWDDALIVLQRCQLLLPVAEELLIVSRCVESLAFMACMEILDPDEQRRDQPGLAAAARGLVGRRWDAELVKELAARDLWIKDLIALPLEFFRRIVQALRRQGMKEKYVSPVVLFYANKWVLSKKTHKFMASTDNEAGGDGETDANRRATAILEGVIDLLPPESSPASAATGGAIPVSFYFALLARSITLELSDATETRLRELVASNLQFARVDDLPLPEQDAGRRSIADSSELRAMESIVSNHVSMQRRGAEAVAELWDRYLTQIVGDPKLRQDRLGELIGVIPAGDRKSHDHLYEAIDTYIVEHPGLSGEEKASLCGHLECRKLSHEACIQAVQNDRMPLRLIVQALFVQQLHTHRAFTECSDSFRCMHSGELLVPGVGGGAAAAYTPSPWCAVIPTSQPLSTSSPYTDTRAAQDGRKLRALTRDRRNDDDDAATSDYETASFRIQALEQEIISLKQTLQRHNTVKGSSRKEPSFRVDAATPAAAAAVRRRAPVSSSSCIGSMRWGSQRRCASRILRIFARLAVFGRGGRSSSRGKQSKCRGSAEQLSSVACRTKHRARD